MNQVNSNPISDIYEGLSPPCGNPTQAFVKRERTLAPIYVDNQDTCKYDDGNGTYTHSLYKAVGFPQKELDIYKANNVLADIKNKVPDYKDSDL